MGQNAEKEESRSPSERTIFDLVVIGGGSAGLSSAFFSTRLGVPTCLIEREKIGGDWSVLRMELVLIVFGALLIFFKINYQCSRCLI